LWLTNRVTTRGCVYAPGSLAILSPRFPLLPATDADFLVEILASGVQTGDFVGFLASLALIETCLNVLSVGALTIRCTLPRM
jgi:hypothetical protein